MMFFKLSLKNIKNSFRNYTIYFITLIIGVAIFYTFNSMDSQTAMLTLSEAKAAIVKSMIQLLSVISVVVSIILGYLIVYANNFLIRRRKKEFGLYQTLGMSKGTIGKLLLVETILVGALSLIVGLFVGVFLSQGMSVLIINLFHADMSAYQFSFSMNALIKSCIYFGIIYVLVMLFNIVSVSRYKLIDLLTASKKNEVLKVKNTAVSVLMFLVSMVCIGIAYYMLRGKHVLTASVRDSVIMLILGTIGTYLLFSSLAGFLLKLVQSRKNLYYRNLNMFVLRQVNSRINTMKVSMTIISIMLLLTIGIMSSALSLVSAFNQDIEKMNRCDITLMGMRNKDTDILKTAKENGWDYQKQFAKTVDFTIYNAKDESCTIDGFIGLDAIKQVESGTNGMVKLEGVKLSMMKESSYNQLMELYGEDKIDLKGNHYALVANYKRFVDLLDPLLEKNKELTFEHVALQPYKDACIKLPLQNSNMEMDTGIFVIPDEMFQEAGFTVEQRRVCADYVKGDTEKIEEQVKEQVRQLRQLRIEKHPVLDYSFSKIEMENSKIGTTAVFTFIGLYLGIIFSITSAAILAIGQLSESADNKERYAILRKIGVDDRMINRSLLLQIGIYFILPLSVAIIHSIVGMREVSNLISIFGNMHLEKNIALTAIFLILIYGGYFTATYFGSKGIIKEKEKYVG